MSDDKPPLAFLLDSDYRSKYPHQLVARFPHVARKIEAMWGNAGATADYFTELMIPSRPNRQGFPPEVAAEIMSLSIAYDRIGHLAVVNQLLDRQANPNLDANDGSTPLLKAVANGHLAVIQVLLNAGAHRQVTLADGTTLDDMVAKTKDLRIRAIFG